MTSEIFLRRVKANRRVHNGVILNRFVKGRIFLKLMLKLIRLILNLDGTMNDIIFFLAKLNDPVFDSFWFFCGHVSA